GPRAIVVAHAIVAQEIGEHEPGVRRTLTDTAVRDHVVTGRESLFLLVNIAEVGGGLECAIAIRRARPRDILGAGDVATAQRSLLRVLRYVQLLARVLVRRADVDQLAVPLHVPPNV